MRVHVCGDYVCARVCLCNVYTSIALYINKGSQNRNSNRAGARKVKLTQRSWMTVATDFLHTACSDGFIFSVVTPFSLMTLACVKLR